jgi:hypothetical protein
MWTLQEIALNDCNKAVFICGQYEIPWRILQVAGDSFRNLGLDKRSLITGPMQIYIRLWFCIHYIRNDTPELLKTIVHEKKRNKPLPQASDIFTACHQQECTNPKDKVYALHGLCSKLNIQLPSPDYRKSTEEIFTEATRAIITHDENLDVLFFVNSPRRLNGLPSWVPDFSDHWIGEGLEHRPSFSLLYEASKSNALYSFSQDSKSLTVLARVMGTVSRIGKPVPIIDVYNEISKDEIPRDIEIWEAFQSWAQIVLDSEDSDGPYGHDWGYWRVAFLRVLTAEKYTHISVHQPDDSPSVFERLDEITIFMLWYQNILGQSDFEKALIETGRISLPGELKKEELAQMHMDYSLLPKDKNECSIFHYYVWAFQRGKSFFKTEEGWMGTVEGLPSENDVVAIISGLSMPLVLSPVGGSYRLVGSAYVHGMMQGEFRLESLDVLKLITII